MAYDPKRKIGPNVKKLLSIKMATDAIPLGSGIEAGIAFLSRKESIVSGFRKAAEFTLMAIDAVREAGDPNPWRNADDETIAAELLRQIDERRQGLGDCAPLTARHKRGWMGARSQFDTED